MDPIAHTFTGAALAATGLKRATPLATAALIVGANIADIDVLAGLGPYFAPLAHRRGWTHGILAIALWPFILTGLFWVYDRYFRPPGRAPVNWRALLGISAIAVLSHPTLDWLNNYGLRWLMPFDGRWFYGDALFIIDPWVWLTLGGAVFLSFSHRPTVTAAWIVLALLGTALVFTTADVTLAARLLWVAGLVAIAAARLRHFGSTNPKKLETAARAALGIVAAYMAISLLLNIPARAEIREALAEAGVESVRHIMVAPVAANPFGGQVVVETEDGYLNGRWNWLGRPRIVLGETWRPKRPPSPAVDAAMQTAAARRYLTWSRFPVFEVERDGDDYVVLIGDARYGGAGNGPGGVRARLSGPAVRLDANLNPIED